MPVQIDIISSQEQHQNMKWFYAGTKKMSVSSFGCFIKLIKVQCTKKWFSPRHKHAEVIFQMSKEEALVLTYEISRRVKIGSCDAEVINKIMVLQIRALSSLNKREKIHIQAFYRKVEKKHGKYPFKTFWMRLRDCFHADEVSTSDQVTQHPIVAFEKPAGRYHLRYEPTINKQAPLVGKAGPEKRKRENDDLSDSVQEDQHSGLQKQIMKAMFFI